MIIQNCTDITERVTTEVARLSVAYQRIVQRDAAWQELTRSLRAQLAACQGDAGDCCSADQLATLQRGFDTLEVTINAMEALARQPIVSHTSTN